MLSSANILIINPDSEGRGRLREALRSVVAKGTYANARALKQALDQMRTEARYDFAFLSTEFDVTQLMEFLGSVKSLSSKQRPVLMLCLKAGDQSSSLVANLYANGAQGFVLEPYSPDQLLESMNVAKEKLSDSAESKEVRITEFLMGDAMRLLDEVADWRSAGHLGGGASGKDLKRVGASLKEAAAKIEPAKFENLLIEKFGSAKTNKKGVEPPKVAKKIKEAPHPGIELRATMAKRQLSKEKLLSITKIDPAELDGILAEQIAISEVTAEELARAMGNTAKHWLQRQKAYDVYIKDKEEAAKKAAL